MPGTAIGISAGTTTYALARRLVDVPGLTVVTNSVPVADVLHRAGRSDQTITLTGGVRTPSDALVAVRGGGPRTIHLDQVFMGVHVAWTRGPASRRPRRDTDLALVARPAAGSSSAPTRASGASSGSARSRASTSDTLVTDNGLPAEAREIAGTRSASCSIAPDGVVSGSAPRRLVDPS